MATNPRSNIIQPGDTVALRAKFRGSDGVPTDLDLFPSVSIIQPSGGVVTGPTSIGVTKIAVGEYEFNYCVGLHPPVGVWRDVWTGTLSGFDVMGEFTFQVNTTQMPAINTDGFAHLGDDPGFNYSQVAICNINILLKSLKRRLKSSGKKKTTDAYGNVIYKDCDVYSTDELVSFIAQSLSEFNEIPMFTMFTFDDTPIIEQFHDILVQGSLYLALGAQALIERGREFVINDNGIGFTPPSVSELISSQYDKEMAAWYEKVKLIKMNMRPSCIGLGTLTFTSGASPLIRRLKHLRERQIF
jgi:hypothetical protein